MWGRYTNGTGEVMMPYKGKGQPTQTKTARALLDYWQTKINGMPENKKADAQARYQTANTRLTGAVATEFQKVKTAQDQVNAATKDQQSKRTKTTAVQVKIKALTAEKKVFQTAIDQLSKDMQAVEKVCETGACFAAGTKLLAKGVWGIGYREIERITTDDYVASRDEHRSEGLVEWKRVEEAFVRTGRLLDLTADGRTIRTTPEHPFYVVGRGWVPAMDLQVGNQLLGQGVRTVAVEKVNDTGEYGVVYNLTVADWHTYFVGCDEWGFSVWSHNFYAWRSLNPQDVIAIDAGGGLSRAGGARGQEAIVALIGSNNQNTLYISATEDFSVVNSADGDPNNYVQFETTTPGLVYISMNDLLTLSNYKKVRDDLKADGKLGWITDQAHGLIVKDLPRAAITKIVTGGVERPL